MKCSGTHCLRPASLLPTSSHKQGSLRVVEKWWGRGVGHHTPSQELPGPHLHPTPPCCLHRNVREFISSYLEYIYCLNHNYLTRQSTLLSDVLSGGHFFPSNTHSVGLLLIMSHLFLFLLEAPNISSCFFFLPPSSCFLPSQCMGMGRGVGVGSED